MSDEQQDLAQQLQEAREHAQRLEEETTKLRQQAAELQNQLDNYRPIAAQWMKEHGPSREECERILQEMLDHPETLVDFETVWRELGINDDHAEGDHAA
jgi:hypothetical protein